MHFFSIVVCSSCQSSTDLCDVDSVTYYGILWHASFIWLTVKSCSKWVKETNQPVHKVKTVIKIIWGLNILSLLQVMIFSQCANSRLIYKYNHIYGEGSVNNPQLIITSKMCRQEVWVSLLSWNVTRIRIITDWQKSSIWHSVFLFGKLFLFHISCTECWLLSNITILVL